ncbi:pyruvate, phosphate dikinase [Oceanithermus desulfurans]
MGWVYAFSETEGLGKELLGGKGFALAEMTRLGFPVPPGFTLTTEACRAYLERGAFPEGLWDEVRAQVERLEAATGKRFGGGGEGLPLLVSVRSGAPVSMPGMMDTILNLGLTPDGVQALAEATGQPRFAWDSYRRLVQMYGEVVLGIEAEGFERLLDRAKVLAGAERDVDLSAADLERLVGEYRRLIEAAGRRFPDDPWQQLEGAVRAVFKSWNNPRARTYRRLYEIPDDVGTAVNVQAMVFGNLGDDSGTGVGFSRNPATGEKGLYGEYLKNAQGEDVVAGVRTPQPLERLRESDPGLYDEIADVAARLEAHFRDMQDFEFTVERGRLYLLQTRAGKRTPEAAVRIAVEMAEEGAIAREEALLRVDANTLPSLLRARIDPERAPEAAAEGLPASPGAAVGHAVLDAETAESWAGRGLPVILVRPETTPEDISGMYIARGILTARGGMTSHAAVVARGMGVPAVVGVAALSLNLEERSFRLGERSFKEGDVISLDGTTGKVFAGEVALSEGGSGEYLHRLLEWAEPHRRLGVRANADTPADARRARELGAEGIGLVRTEHMFFDPERIPWVRALILAETEKEEREALERLFAFQRADFMGLLEAMDGLPVTVRLLDPPLHEFLPPLVELERKEAAGELAPGEAKVLAQVRQLHEINPMLGFRGVRLLLVRPEILRMQVAALLSATRALREQGKDPRPELMIPLVSTPEEVEQALAVVREVFAEFDLELPVGTMIETPRAALTASGIAPHVDFFSFGTNDLTQLTFGISRDDAGHFLPRYLDARTFAHDPTERLDEAAVGRLLEIAVREGRAARPDLKLGICGEHGGEARSVHFAHRVGLDYVSASPFRVLTARLAAAQAALAERSPEA